MSLSQDPHGINRYAIWILLFIFVVITLVVIYICCETGGRAVPVVDQPEVTIKASKPPERTMVEAVTDVKDPDNAEYIEFNMKSVF